MNRKLVITEDSLKFRLFFYSFLLVGIYLVQEFNFLGLYNGIEKNYTTIYLFSGVIAMNLADYGLLIWNTYKKGKTLETQSNISSDDSK